MESGRLLAHSDEPSAASKPDGRGRGGWRAALFIIAIGFLERIGFYGVQGNLMMYLTGPMGMSMAAAAAAANAWGGTVLVLTLVGALAADSHFGRYRAVVAAGVLYLLGSGMLVLSSTLEPTHARPASCNGGATACSSPLSPTARHAFFYAALYLLALAQGFHQPCSEAFGADQFAAASDDADPDPAANASRSSYFNWFHFSISCGYAVAITLLSYVEDNVGWTAGFAACWATMVLYLAVFLLGTGTYRVGRPVDGAPLALLAKTSAAAARAWTRKVFSRKDSICAERLLSKEEVDAKGYLVNLLPIWLISIVFAIVAAQDVTLFTKQGSTMDRHVGGLVVPPAALQFAMSVTILVMLPVYDRALVPLARRFTRHPAGITTLQRVGAGMAMSCLAMAVAALVEAKRLRAASDAGLIDRPDATVPMGVWWLVPQYVLLGISKVLSIIGLEEFFYGQATDALRSVGLATSLSAQGIGSYASGALVSTIDWGTTRSGGYGHMAGSPTTSTAPTSTTSTGSSLHSPLWRSPCSCTLQSDMSTRTKPRFLKICNTSWQYIIHAMVVCKK